MGKFKLNLNEWTEMSVDSAKLLYSESVDFLNYTINLSDKITQRAYTLSVIIIAALGGLTSKLLSIKILTCHDKLIFTLLVISVIVLFIMGIILSRIIFPYTLAQHGRQPREINDNKFLVPENLTKEQAHLSFLINEIQNTQNKIDLNKEINAKRLRTLKLLIILILSSFMVFVLIFSLITYLVQ